jgi:arylsulfatase
VSLVSVLPTLAEAVGAGIPAQAEGRSHWGVLAGSRRFQPRDVLIENAYVNNLRTPWHLQRGIRSGRFKAIGSTFSLSGDGPWSWELYNLARDPGERSDLSRSLPGLLAHLRGAIEPDEQPRPVERELVPQDLELLEKLRSLGYVE